MEKGTFSSAVTPLKIFGALIFLNLLLAMVVVVFPEGKIKFGQHFSLDFVPLRKVFEKNDKKVVDAKKVIANIQTVDTNLVALDHKTLAKLKLEKIDVPENKRIQYPDNTRTAMSAFFLALASPKCES